MKRMQNPGFTTDRNARAASAFAGSLQEDDVKGEPKAKLSCMLMLFAAILVLGLIIWIASGAALRKPQPTPAAPDRPGQELEPGSAPPV